MIKENLTMPDFKAALEQLNTYLNEMSADAMDIRAVGGWALMYNGIRENGITSDIDTVTPAYEPKVQSAIHRVADEQNLPQDWINNDTVFSFGDEVTEDDIFYYDQMLNANYVPSDLSMNKINISVADLPTLTKAKAYAVMDIGMGRTTKDLSDFMSLLDAQDIHTTSAFMDKFEWANEPEFTPCLHLLDRTFNQQHLHALNKIFDDVHEQHKTMSKMEIQKDNPNIELSID